MSTDRPHPAACPYCKGTAVNQCQPVFLVRPAVLKADGSIAVGDCSEDATLDSGEAGPRLLVCHGCNSTFVQPAQVPQYLDPALEVSYPDPPSPGQPGYVGMGVAWTPAPAGPAFQSLVGGQG